MGLAQRVYPAPCSRRSFTCQPATPSVNLCALWKAYQLVRKGAASASYKTSLRRRVLTPSLQKSSLVKAQIVFYSFAVTRSSKKGEEPNEVVLPCFEFLRVLLVFLLYILYRTGEAKRNPLKKIHSFVKSDLQ